MRRTACPWLASTRSPNARPCSARTDARTPLTFILAVTNAELFSGHSREYAEYRPAYPQALIDYLAELVTRRETAWEAGCGSGQFSIPLASRFERVIATDASAEQVRHAVAHPRVEYRVAPAEASGVPDATADLAVAAQAAHWFDLDGYYAEVRRVAKPDGIVALVTYGSTTIDALVDAIVHRFYSKTVGAYWAPARLHVEQGYRSLHFPFREITAPPFEMVAEWTVEQLTGYVETWSATRALLRAEGEAKVHAFRAELADAWGSGAATRTVRWPLAMRIGRVSMA